MLRGIFFDLDDTLIGYADAERSALEVGCALAARANPAIDTDALYQAIYDAYEKNYAYGTPGYTDLAHLPVDAFRRRLTAEALAALGVPDAALTEAIVSAYAAAETEALRAFPDAETTLSWLRPHFRLGLITNGPSAMQRAKLGALALDGYFEAIVVDTEFGHPKPDERIFQHAARQVGLAPDELLFIGNSLAHDIAGARAAGWASVWLSTSPLPADHDGPIPDYTISRLFDLMTLPPVAEALPLPEKV